MHHGRSRVSVVQQQRVRTCSVELFNDLVLCCNNNESLLVSEFDGCDIEADPFLNGCVGKLQLEISKIALDAQRMARLALADKLGKTWNIYLDKYLWTAPHQLLDMRQARYNKNAKNDDVVQFDGCCVKRAGKGSSSWS